MQVINFTTTRPTMSETRTYEDFYKYMAVKPQRLGVVSRKFTNYTASFLTEALGNVIYQDSKKKNKYQPLNSMYYEWDIKTSFIKEVLIVDTVVGDGTGDTFVTFPLGERYYEKYDIFKVKKTGQLFQVLQRPIRKADNYWEYVCKVVADNYNQAVDTNGTQIGDATLFVSNAMPEMHEEGYVKYQASVEKFRNYITTHRVDVSYSALYAALEDIFVSVKTAKNGKPEEEWYKMNSAQKDLLDNFLFVRNNGLLFNKNNVDINGKSTISDPDTGRPIYISDGIIPQASRFANKYVVAVNQINVGLFNRVLADMASRADEPTGNDFVFICNERFWQTANVALFQFFANFSNAAAALYSKKGNGYLEVGATFQSYIIAGNKVTFKVDKAFSREYGDKAFAICLDLTPDKTSGEPAMALFTLKGGDFISNSFSGVGGLDGLTSGPVASPVAASKLINWGYSSAALFNPYKSCIIREA